MPLAEEVHAAQQPNNRVFVALAIGQSLTLAGRAHDAQPWLDNARTTNPLVAATLDRWRWRAGQSLAPVPARAPYRELAQLDRAIASQSGVDQALTALEQVASPSRLAQVESWRPRGVPRAVHIADAWPY